LAVDLVDSTAPSLDIDPLTGGNLVDDGWDGAVTPSRSATGIAGRSDDAAGNPSTPGQMRRPLSRAKVRANRCNRYRKVSWLTSMQHHCIRLPTLRRASGGRICNITAGRMKSGLL